MREHLYFILSITLMLHRHFPLYLFALLLLFAACEPTEEILTEDPDVQLSFSTDTLYFDTLITDVRSRTFRFRAYNTSNNAVNITKISLGKGSRSSYSMVVNGIKTAAQENLRLLGGDSLMVLVTANLENQDQNLPYIVQDSIVFETNGNTQDVKLISWGQDANFLRDSVLDCNTVWTADRPYVIYDAVLVPKDCQLTVEAGAKIYLYNNANILVGGSIQVRGTPQDTVVFTSVRQDEPYNRTPGQWGAMVFLGSSQNNKIEGMRMSNGLFGLYVEPSSKEVATDLTVSKSIIQNMAFAGVWSFGASISMDYCLVNNCLAQTVACILGGNYRFQNCTFANYSFDFFREEPSVLFSNFAIIGDNPVFASDLNVTMSNSIVWGSLEEEFLYPEQLEEVESVVNLSNCLVRSGLATTAFQTSSLLLEDPLFVKPEAQDFRLDTLSPARDMGTSHNFMTDLLGNAISSNPDLGAYEFQP